MFFAVITVFPEMFSAVTDVGITGRAFTEGRASLALINPRDYAVGNYRRVDDRPFGGGPGMVMMAEPLTKAIQAAKQAAATHGCRVESAHCPVVYLSPQGERWSEAQVVTYKSLDGMILLCGRYEGVDERLIQRYVDVEISLGDFVLTGGELAAMMVMDSLIRRLPEVMGDALSAEQDSFVDGLLDCPQYTKPVQFEDMAVPPVLLSGHHQDIAKWRFLQQVKRTKERRPDLWAAFCPTPQQRKWLADLDRDS